MDEKKPLVSVIMPAYNAGRFISQAIDSVLNQSYDNWELLIVNDGSSDNTAEVVKRYSDKRIQLREQENKGVSSARNSGLRQMTGSFYCFLDADDVLPPDSLAQRLNAFTDPVDYVDGIVRIFDHSMSNVLRIYSPSFRGRPLQELVRLKSNCFFGPSWMIRKKEPLIFFNETLTHGEDLLYYIELARHGGEYSFVKNDIYHYRSHVTSAMNNLDDLGKGYRKIFSIIKGWSDVSANAKVIYQLKMRKFMFLAYCARKQYGKAVSSLLS
jgi:teichuronic acid biosynthesis glycosyltransferase TuaG